MNLEISKRVALYGGAFDPPHRGHLSIITNLRSLSFVDEIWVLPSGDRNDKKLLFSMNQRFALLRKLVTNESGLTPVKLCEDEIILSKQSNRMIPTIELLEHFDKQYPVYQFHVVVGADIFSTISTWQHYRKLLDHRKFIVYPRVGYDISSWETGQKPAHYFLSSFLAPNISSSLIKKTIQDEHMSKVEKRERVEEFLDEITLQLLKTKSYL